IEIEKSFWCSKNHANPFEGIEALKRFWENPQDTIGDWKAQDRMFWICRKRAYSQLALNWKGSCTIGIIQCRFFLLPRKEGNTL
ncbi:ENR1 protein, partial [Regulus satrapa]|nr:ENR1 protein [Regulus satrapa]